MAIDSSANLLFNISADPSEAQGNIARFRGLLSKDLGAMRGEFASWSNSVFGNLATVSGGFAALGAALAAGVVAAFGVMQAAGAKWVSYVSEIAKASRVTGIGVEDMSRLAEAAEMTGVPLDAVTRGLGFLYKSIALANQGSEKQIEMFRRQGIGARELAEAEKNPLPILMRLADAFHDNASAVQKAGMGREEFGRGWAELLPLLSRGSAAIREMGETANGTSKIVTAEAVVAAREYKLAVRELKEQHEALNYTIGRESMPLLMQWAVAQATAARMAVEAVKAPMDTLKGMFVANLKGIATLGLWPVTEFVLGFRREMAKVEADAKRLAKLGTEKPTGEFLPTETKETAKETKQEFYGLSSIVETLRGRMAALAGDEAKVLQQAQHFRVELEKAEDELFKLAAAGKIIPATFEREFGAMKDLSKMILGFSDAELQAVLEKRNAGIAAAGVDLQQRLLAQQERTAEGERAAWDAEMVRYTAHLGKEKGVLEAHQAGVEELRRAGHYKIAREQNEAFVTQLERLQHHLTQMFTARQTAMERVKWQYDEDLVRFGAVEEAKDVLAASSEAKRETIRRQYDMNRAAAFARYGEEMTALYNSQGWRGLFGAEFAEAIRGNETLLREWAYSADQSLMMVRVAMESLKEMAQQAFGQFAHAMAQNIAQAFVYRKSIGEAMRAAAAETLAAIAAESLVQAIYATAIGFIRLAQHDYVAAGEAFQAAGLFAAVGVSAAITGRAIAPKQRAAEAAGGAGKGSTGGGAAAEAQEPRGARVQIIINGHIVGRQGIEELTQMINEAVRDRDVPLVASGVKNNTRLLR